MTWHSWLTSAFLTGHHTPTQDGGFRQDAAIGSITYFLFTASVAVGINTAVVFQLESDQSIKLSPLHEHYLLTTYMVVAIVVIWFMACKEYTDMWISCRGEPISRNRRGPRAGAGQYIKENILLVGLAVFFVIGLVDDFIAIFGYSLCMDAYTKCDIVFLYGPKLAYRCTRIVFRFSLLMFCIKFHSVKFKSVPWLRFCLCTVLSATVTNWLHMVLLEIAEQVRGTREQRDLGSCNVTASMPIKQVSNHTLGCITGHTGAFQAHDKSFPFIYPTHIEFSIIVTEIVAKLWIKAEDNPLMCEGLQLEDEEETCFQESDALLPSARRDQVSKYRLLTTGSTTITALLSVIAIIVAFLIEKDHSEGDLDVRVVFYGINLVRDVSALLVCFAAFQLTSRFRSSAINTDRSYSGIEKLLLLSSGFIYFGVVNDIVADSACLLGTSINGEYTASSSTLLIVMLMNSVFLLIQVPYQTCFVLHAARVQSNSLCLSTWKNICVMHLCIHNFTYWLIRGVIYACGRDVNQIGNFYLSSEAQATLDLIVLPWAVFYGFTSGILLLKTYLD